MSTFIVSRTETDTDTLRILAVNKRCWVHPRAGGSEYNLRETLTRLADRGHEPHLLVAGYDGAAARTNIDGVEIRRVGKVDRFPAPWDVVVAYILVTLSFYWYAFLMKPHVVYTVNTPLPWLIVTRFRQVGIFHHIAIDSFFETHPFPQNVLGYVSQWIGVLRERNAPTVSVSPSTTAELTSRGHDPETVHEIRNGLDLEAYQPGESASAPRVVYVGGLERYKGADRLPAIHRAIEAQYNAPVRLDVAGREGQVSDAIEAYCAGHESASFHGFVSEARKIELLQSAWVFLCPSRVEGWGIAVLEANACGTPAVGSDVKGLRDSIHDGDTGRLAPGDDPDAFAKAVVTLLRNDDDRQKLAANARSWAEEHSWEQATDELAAVFQSVADS